MKRGVPWNKIVVVGAGLSGRAAAAWCRRSGAEVLLCDARPVEEWPEEVVALCRELGIETAGGDSDPSLLQGADLLIPSPGVPQEHPLMTEAARRGMDTVGELALGVALWEGPVIGVTGTNGKTTTTLLISHLLEAAGVPHVTGGNCTPPLMELMASNAPGTVAVVEVSSFQLDTFPPTRTWERRGMEPPRFRCGLLLNLSYDHLDRYPSLEGYAGSKARLMELTAPGGIVILPHGDRGLDFWQPPAGREVLRFENLMAGPPKGGRVPRERERGAWFEDGVLRVELGDGQVEEYPLDQWPLIGPHNRSNLAAAVLAARAVGASPAGIARGIAGFKGLPHRIEPVARCRGIRFVNDSKATNVAATLAALESLEPPLVVILGGRGKGEVYERLTHAAMRGLFQGAVLMGEEAEPLRRAVVGHCPVRMVGARQGLEAMREAVELGAQLLEGGGTLLLSPACASFDMFRDYRHRGATFKRVVEEWCG